MRQELVKIKIEKKTGIMKIETDQFRGEGCAAIEEVEQFLGTRTKHEDKDERFNYTLHTPITVGTSG